MAKGSVELISEKLPGWPGHDRSFHAGSRGSRPVRSSEANNYFLLTIFWLKHTERKYLSNNLMWQNQRSGFMLINKLLLSGSKLATSRYSTWSCKN